MRQRAFVFVYVSAVFSVRQMAFDDDASRKRKLDHGGKTMPADGYDTDDLDDMYGDVDGELLDRLAAAAEQSGNTSALLKQIDTSKRDAAGSRAVRLRIWSDLSH